MAVVVEGDGDGGGDGHFGGGGRRFLAETHLADRGHGPRVSSLDAREKLAVSWMGAVSQACGAVDMGGRWVRVSVSDGRSSVNS